MTIRVLPEARRELRDAADFYEEQQSGLGRRLWQEIDEHIAWIAQHGEVPRLRPGGYRRVNLHIFPYFIAYIIRSNVLWILAIAHTHRQPEHWIEREKTIG